jgi:hypothetical protein
MDINTIFARQLLKQVHGDVRKAFPDIRPMRAAKVTGPHGRNQYFVRIHAARFPAHDDYYIAENFYEARAKAWRAFIEKHARITSGDTAGNRFGMQSFIIGLPSQ